MKKTIALLVSALLVTTVQAKAVTFKDTPPIVSLSEMSLEKIQEFIGTKNPEFIIELTESAAIPVQFLAKNRIFSAMIDPNFTFKVDKTCYFRIVKKKFYMSEDLVNWKKADKFMKGIMIPAIYPNPNKPGLIVEGNIVPDSMDIE